MRRELRLAPVAEQDVLDIESYIASQSSPERAIDTLAQLPDRGRLVPELADTDEQDARELVQRPYRIVYQLTEDAITVIAVVDGRRDVKDLLRQRGARQP